MSKIIEKLKNSFNKGELLECILKVILEADNFYNIRRQKNGSQFGFDLFASKNNGVKIENWKFECKNLKTKVNIENFAPKIIWHLSANPIDKFVLVTILDISNDLFHFLESSKFSFPIEIWSGDYLESKISKNKNALSQLDLLDQFNDIEIKVEPIIFSPSKVNFYINHALNPPFSYDFFYINDIVNKTFTENHFKLISSFENDTDTILNINSIVVKTLKYYVIESRVLRQHKVKGIYKVENFTFSPKSEDGDEVELLSNNSILKILPKSNETISFELTDNSKSGYYELVFIAKGFLKAIPVTYYSPMFPLHIKGKFENFLQLSVIGKHYDSPVTTLLNLDKIEWDNLRRKTWDKNLMVYLGSTYDDIINNKMASDWQIKTAKLKKISKNESNIKLNSKVYMDLNIPISEKPYDINDSFNNILRNI